MFFVKQGELFEPTRLWEPIEDSRMTIVICRAEIILNIINIICRRDDRGNMTAGAA